MSIGETLASARRNAGLTVARVSEITCIRETIVTGIEHDEFGLCGGDFYARGHIRSIATAAGIDPEPLVEQYDRERGGSPRAASKAQAPDSPPPSATARSGRLPRPNWSVALGALLLVAVVLGVFQLFSGSPGPASQRGPVAASPSESWSAGEEARQRPAHRGTGPRGSASPNDSQARSGGPSSASRQAAVRLRARDETWVRAKNAEGERLFEGTLYEGDSRVFTADTLIRLRVGNAGGVFVTFNGRNLGTVGELGDVVDLRVYPSHIEGLS